MTYTVQIRPKRQITLPKAALEQMGVSIGDQLSLNLNSNQATLIPHKAIALDALKSIQKIFAQSGIPESEMQQAAEQVRYELSSRLH